MRLPVLLLALGACGTAIHATIINPAPHPMPPRSPAQVEMFTSAPPARPYVDIAYLEAEQESEFSAANTQEFFATLREKAAAMGCDAVVIGNPKNRDVASLFSNGRVGLNGLTATCIAYVDEVDAVAAKR